MLVINDLHAGTEDRQILRGLSLTVPDGEIHAVMGPNGAGKSTLAHVLAGRQPYRVTSGQVTFDGTDLLGLEPEERAAAGIFLAFQHPVEIPGVTTMYFLRTALNAVRRARGQEEIGPADFLKLVQEKATMVGMDRALMNRSVNEGFSGGEKKRNEILQMAILEPRLAVLDETDSGLDIDALRAVAAGVNALRRPDRAALVITHHQQLLDYVVPDRVHVLAAGQVVRTGGPELATELEARGYTDLGDDPDSAGAGDGGAGDGGHAVRPVETPS
ncbi:MAG: Fe-S cluster assembly ATPase SufC [Acidimicrobiales bacterium]